MPDSDTIYFGSNHYVGAGVQPVMSYKYNGQNANFHGRVGIGLSTDGGHESVDAKLEVSGNNVLPILATNSGGDTIARFTGTDDNAYIRVTQTVDATGAAGMISENNGGS